MKNPTSQNLVAKLLQLGAHLQREGNRLTQPFGLNQQQFVFLRQVVLHGPKPQGEISSRLLLQKAHISKMADKLCQMGLLQKEALPQDGRSHLLMATPQGKAKVEEIMQVLEAWNQAWVEPLSVAEQELLLQLLHRL